MLLFALFGVPGALLFVLLGSLGVIVFSLWGLLSTMVCSLLMVIEYYYRFSELETMSRLKKHQVKHQTVKIKGEVKL